MRDATKISVRAVALRGEEVSREITGMLRQLLAANQAESLPAGFSDHAADLISAKSTILRVCAEIRAATAHRRAVAA